MKRVRVIFHPGKRSEHHRDDAIELDRSGTLVKVQYRQPACAGGVYVGWIRADRVQRLPFTRRLLAAARPLSLTPPWLA